MQRRKYNARHESGLEVHQGRSRNESVVKFKFTRRLLAGLEYCTIIDGRRIVLHNNFMNLFYADKMYKPSGYPLRVDKYQTTPDPVYPDNDLQRLSTR